MGGSLIKCSAGSESSQDSGAFTRPFVDLIFG